MATTMERQSVVTRADRVPGPEQGHWTYNHYAALPDDGRRYEIVDGVLFNMIPAPGIPHQKAVQRLLKTLSAHVEDAGLGSVFIAPVDVVLSPKVVVQPDVLVVLNESSGKITGASIVGAPDLVVEVSSPATAGYDRREKQDAYARSGVPEYWIADPASRTIEVRVLEGEAYHSAGVFSGQAALLSKIVLTIAEVRVEQFFV